MAGPVKRSVMIAGHATSLSLEPIFWDALATAAREDRLPLNALVARIDAARIEAPEPANLASAIRVWLFARVRTGREMLTVPPSPPPFSFVDNENDSQ